MVIIPQLGGGGAEKMMIHLCNEFIKRNIEVTLMCLKENGNYKEIVSDEVVVVKLKTRLRYALLPLTRKIISSKPDVIISALTAINIVSIIAWILSCKKSKLCVTERNHLSSQLKYNYGFLSRSIILFLLKVLYPKANNVIGISQGVIVDLAELIGVNNNQSFIYNPVLTSEMLESLIKDRVYHPWFLDNTNSIIIACGRLVPQKDYSTLLKAFQILRSTKNARLMVLGSGPLENDLKALANELNIKNDVDFLGHTNNPMLYMKQSHLFVLSSAWEGFGNVLVEALACGLTIVSTDCPSGPAEILDNGKFGYLSAVSDYEMLAESMDYALSNQLDSEVQIARSIDFTSDKISNQFMQTIFCKKLVH